MNERISIIVCTYNSKELIKKCVESIIRQKYSGKKELFLVDGGSDKETVILLNNYCKKFKWIKFLKNEKKFPEGKGMGKWLAWKKCSGKFVFIIDQDNELQGENCIEEMLEPFENPLVFGCACKLTLFKSDNLTNKYIALQGTDPFFAYKSLDGIIDSGKFLERSNNYSLLKIAKKNPIITGGNCFVYKKSYLDSVGGYTKDSENVIKLVKNGFGLVAITKNTKTHHLAVKGFLDFLRKKKKWAMAYQYSESDTNLKMNQTQRREMILNLFSIFTFFPSIFTGIKKGIKYQQTAWVLHPILRLYTGIIYLIYAFLRLKIKHFIKEL